MLAVEFVSGIFPTGSQIIVFLMQRNVVFNVCQPDKSSTYEQLMAVLGIIQNIPTDRSATSSIHDNGFEKKCYMRLVVFIFKFKVNIGRTNCPLEHDSTLCLSNI